VSDLCACYGGEEFVVLLPSETAEGAILIAGEIRARVLSLRAQQQDAPMCSHRQHGRGRNDTAGGLRTARPDKIGRSDPL
jgi:GGDEF domain-containing protein